MSRWSEASKQVGWEHRSVKYPTIAQVDKAYEEDDLYTLVLWHRYLRSPIDEDQRETLACIEDRLFRLRKFLEERE